VYAHQQWHLLWDVDGPDLGGPEQLLLAGHELLEEVNRDVVVRREVDPHVGRQEVVDFSLGSILRCELLGGHADPLWLLVSWRLWHVIVVADHAF
jgi:hypothetical protein